MKISTLVAFSFLFTAAAQATPLKAVNDYKNINCVSPPDFEALAGTVKLTERPSGGLCDDSYLSRLGKVLSLANRLGIKDLKGWTGGASVALANPLAYLRDMNRSFALDMKTVTAVAYNSNRGSIFLGIHFFNDSPLGSVLTLVHETRHSSESDPRHTACVQGDIPFSQGGCDAWLRTDESAGAYAYQVSYSYGLAKLGGLAKPDVDYLMASSLSTIGTRFNRVPNFLAMPFDVAAVLDTKGKVSLVHPFLHRRLDTGISIPGQKIVRLEFDNSRNGLILHTDAKKIFYWQPGKKISSPNKELIPESKTFRDSATLNSPDATYRYYLGDDNLITYTALNTETRKYAVFPSAMVLGNGLEGKRLLSGGHDVRYVETKDGQLLYWDTANTRFAYSKFRFEKEPWQSLSSSVAYSLFGLTTERTLYYKAESGEPAKSWFQVPQSRKYAEGVSARVQLDDHGRLTFTRHDSEKKTLPFKTDGDKLVDVAFIRNYRAADLFNGPEEIEGKFATLCNVAKPLKDPWLQKGMGVDAGGKLIFEGDSEQPCQQASVGEGEVRWKSVALQGTDVAENTAYSKTSLKLTNDKGEVTTLHPYAN